MSSHSEERLNTRYLAIFLILGLLLRCVGLFLFPAGMEGDEAVVVYWGRKWIEEGRWLLISYGEIPAWETPSAYFFGALDLWGISPRVGAVFISFLEVGLCYLWVLRRSSRETALLAATFLALMPWHFFFSYVLGPCVAGLWTSLYLLDLKNPFGRMFVSFGGLAYYASFRVVLLWGGLVNLMRRRWWKLGADIAGAVTFFGALFLLGEDHIKGFISKGSYLVERGWQEALHHYLNAVLLWWLPPLQTHWGKISEISMDDVGYGFANMLGPQSPLSYGTSLFFAWGLYICFKNRTDRDICGLFLLALVLVGFSPSYVHFPFILPVVAFVAAVGASQILKKNQRAVMAVYLSLLLSLGTLAYMLGGLKSRDRWRIFSGDSEKVSQLVLAQTKAPFIWTSGIDYTKARLAADRAGIPITFFGINHVDWLNRMQMMERENKAKWVFIQAITMLERPRPEIKNLLLEAQKDYEKRLILFENNHFIKSKKEISYDGITLGVLYELGD
ncbi:hypothetical protein [Bdellovibrio sp.]|uniref:hypothetical protein n=1 Tax=Bdellovibrio sp. TaxID=28201 RepID=UPI0039E40910